MKSYDHFCFFAQINNSKKKKDDFAFFVFFTFKGWKRLLLADAPRQVINGITLYSFARSVKFTTDISKWYDGSFAKASVLLSMAFTGTPPLQHISFLHSPLIFRIYLSGTNSHHLGWLIRTPPGRCLSICSTLVLYSGQLEGILLS